MRNIPLLLLASLVVFSFSLPTSLGLEDNSLQEGASERESDRVLGDNAEDLRRLSRIFLRDGQSERVVNLQSYRVPVWVGDLDTLDWQTDMVLGAEESSRTSFRGWLSTAYPLDLEEDERDELVVEILSGKTINAIVYRYVDGVLERIPVSTEKPGPYGFVGTATRNSPEFKDLDGDGVLEMLVYYRFFPPEKRRRVEVYKFDGSRFDKIREYEEPTDEVYL